MRFSSLLLALSLGLGGGLLASASAAPGDIVSSIPHQGTSPFDCTVDLPLNEVVVVDLLGGMAFKYDLGLTTPLASIPAPTGTNTAGGIAFFPGNDHYFWIDASASTLIETTRFGMFVGSVPLIPPPGGGVLGGMAYDDGAGTLWIVEIFSDVYHEYDFSGVPTGNSFANPSGSGVSGAGIAHLAGTPLFEIPHGVSGVDTLSRVDAMGVVQSSISLASVPDGAILGNAAHPVGTAGTEVAYLVGNSTATIFQLQVGEDPAPFRRGDANVDGGVDVADAVFLLGVLFSGTPPASCLDAGDSNDDGALDVADAVYLLSFLFVAGSPPPPAPHPGCGVDPTGDGLDCAAFSPCP